MARKAKPLISAGEIRTFLLVTLALSVVAGGLTALVTILNVPPEPKNQLPPTSPFKASVDDTIPKDLLLSDFLFSGPAGALGSRDWILSRPEKKAWTDEEVRHYWVEPSKTDSVQLPQKNDQAILQFLKDIP